MGAQSPERRLAAIFAADVVGYSRLMSEREEATLANLHVCLDIFHDCISSHRGRVFGSAGDSVIAEFSSAVEAVSCAVEIQQALAHRNAGVAGEDRMQFRIGISVGDVIVEGNNLMGEGVNIAARLENLAEAGGINISNDVYRQVQGKFAANYKDVGLQNLKNIPEPVRVYRVTNKINEAQSVNPRLRTLGRRHIMSAIVVLVIVSSLFVFINVRQHHQTMLITIPAVVTAGLISEQPSLAVLPFDNLSHDRNQDYFIDGITEDLITDLSQISSLRVIARNSVFTYKGQAVNIKEVARELGVSHVLEGSVRKVGNRIRVNAQLIDALTGHHLWAERFDRDLTDVFAVQDEVTDLITSALKLKLSDREKSELAKKYTYNVEAYDLFLQGQREFFKFNREGNLEARRLYREATVLEPNYARAFANLGWTYAREYQDGWSSNPYKSLKTAEGFVEKAVELDPNSSHVQWVLGQIMLFNRDYEGAMQAVRKAIELSPSNPDPKILLARILAFSGNSRESVRLIKEAMKTNPHYPMQYAMNLGIAHFANGEYDKAEVAFLEAINRNPDAQRVRMWLAATYANAGRIEEATWQFEELMLLNPYFSIENIEATIPLQDETFRDRLINGIRTASN